MPTLQYGPRLPVHDHEALRHIMIEHQLHGVQDHRVLDAMRRVPRHLFAPEAIRDRAYEDAPLPVGNGQFLLRPNVIARMLQAANLRGSERVLEVGVTSGYETALLSLLAKEVYALEAVPNGSHVAQHNLVHADLAGAHFVQGDATTGWPGAAPYDVIVLTSPCASIPEPLLEQLAHGGRLVCPVGPEPLRAFKRVSRGASGFDVVEIAVPAPPVWD